MVVVVSLLVVVETHTHRSHQSQEAVNPKRTTTEHTAAKAGTQSNVQQRATKDQS